MLQQTGKVNRMLLGFITLLSIHVFVVSIPSLLIFLVYIEFLFLLYVLIFRGIRDYLLLLTIVATVSFDISIFVSEKAVLYSIFNLPTLGYPPFLYLSIFATIMYLFKYKINYSLFSLRAKVLIFISIYIFVVGIVMGGITYLLNDNNIKNIGFHYYFMSDFSRLIIVSIYLFLFSIFSQRDPLFLNKLKNVIFALIISLIIVAFVFSFFSVKGYYSQHEIILIPLSFIYTLSIFLFYFDKEFRGYRFLIVLLISMTLYMQFFMSNALAGKTWIVLIFVFISIYIRFVKALTLRKRIVALFFIPLFTMILTVLLNRVDSSDETLNALKFEQFTSLIKFENSSYYDNISSSPKTRIDEFLNTYVEYMDKPYLSVFGKGFGGGIKDNLSLFGFYNESAFTDQEYKNNYFVNLHESINIFFLKYGIIGLLLLVVVVFMSLKNISKNAYIFIGLIWFVFFVRYSMNLAILGISSFSVGFIGNESYGGFKKVAK